MFPRGLVYLEIVGSHNDLYGFTIAEQIDAFVHLLEGKAMGHDLVQRQRLLFE